MNNKKRIETEKKKLSKETKELKMDKSNVIFLDSNKKTESIRGIQK